MYYESNRIAKMYSKTYGRLFLKGILYAGEVPCCVIAKKTDGEEIVLYDTPLTDIIYLYNTGYYDMNGEPICLGDIIQYFDLKGIVKVDNDFSLIVEVDDKKYDFNKIGLIPKAIKVLGSIYDIENVKE